jgi:hypothetical protein
MRPNAGEVASINGHRSRFSDQAPVASFIAGIETQRLSKISGDQIVRTSASTNIDPGRGGTYQIAVGIERLQKTRLVEAGIWLNSLQCILVDEKRCFYSAIVSPKSYGTPRGVI